MILHVGLFDIIHIIFVGIIIAIFVVLAIINWIKKWNEWRKTGFCRHDFDIYDTLDASQVHWYKCDKCGTKKLM